MKPVVIFSVRIRRTSRTIVSNRALESLHPRRGIALDRACGGVNRRIYDFVFLRFR